MKNPPKRVLVAGGNGVTGKLIVRYLTGFKLPVQVDIAEMCIRDSLFTACKKNDPNPDNRSDTTTCLHSVTIDDQSYIDLFKDLNVEKTTTANALVHDKSGYIFTYKDYVFVLEEAKDRLFKYKKNTNRLEKSGNTLILPAKSDVYKRQAGSSPRVGTNQSRSELTVILKPWEERKKGGMSLKEVMDDVRAEFKQYPEALVFLSTPPVIPGLGTSGGFELQVEARNGATFENLVDPVATLVKYCLLYTS